MTTFLALSLTGLVVGCVYALTACGLVVTYTTSGVFNFAHGGIGMVAAFSYWQLTVGWGLPPLLAFPLVLLVLAPLFGALVERILIRPLYGAPIGVTLVATLGLLVTLLGVGFICWPPDETRVLPKFFEGHTITLFSLVIDYNQLLVIATSIVVAIGLRYFFSLSRLGIAMRAVVDDPELAALAGTKPERISQLSWALGASLAALAGVLLAPLETLNVTDLTLLVINGYAAAMIGRLKNLPATVIGALVVGISSKLFLGYLPGRPTDFVYPIIPMILLFVAVLFLRQERLRAGSLAGLRIPRTASRRQAGTTGAVFVGVAAVVASQLGPADLATGGRGLVVGFIMLSLVLLSGYAGQVSLCQLTFAGLGAYAMGKSGGGLLGLALAVLLPAAVGALVALSVVRLRGIFLALATLAFAQAMDKVFFLHALGYGGTLAVPRPFGLTDDRAYFVFLAVVLALGCIGVLEVRRRAFGRRLIALNDSPAASATMGVSPTVTRLVVFSMASGIAGLGGALFGGLNGQVSNNDFLLLSSCVLLLLATLGGLYTPSGVVVFALFYALFPVLQVHVPQLGQVQFLLTGLGVLTLGRNRYGFGGQVAELGERLRAPRTPRRLEVARAAG